MSLDVREGAHMPVTPFEVVELRRPRRASGLPGLTLTLAVVALALAWAARRIFTGA